MKDFLLNKVIAWMLGGKLFETIKGIVGTLSKEDISGVEKREKAIAQLKDLAGDISMFLVNLGIEAAVALLKSKQTK